MITVVCCDDQKGDPFYKFAESVNFINLGNRENIALNNIFLKLRRELSRIIGNLNETKIDYYYIKTKYDAIVPKLNGIIREVKPDVIIAFDWRSLILLNIFMKLDIPVIAMIHTYAKFYFNDSISKLKLEAFKKSKCIQVLLKQDIELVKKYCPNTIVKYIPNYAPVILSKKLLNDSCSIVMVARINKNKQQLHLLQAYNKIKDKFPNWDIFFYGATSNNDISYKKELIDFVEKNDLKEKVFFMGLKENVISELVKHDIFAFPSKYEGLSMALIEAMSSGLPAIGYKTSPGVNELIKDGYNGFLCDNNIDSFANKLSILMQSQEIREEMGKNAANSMEEFSANNILNKWEVLINKIVEEDKENEKF